MLCLEVDPLQGIIPISFSTKLISSSRHALTLSREAKPSEGTSSLYTLTASLPCASLPLQQMTSLLLPAANSSPCKLDSVTSCLLCSLKGPEHTVPLTHAPHLHPNSQTQHTVSAPAALIIKGEHLQVAHQALDLPPHFLILWKDGKTLLALQLQLTWSPLLFPGHTLVCTPHRFYPLSLQNSLPIPLPST